MMSAKLATLDILEINAFWKKVLDVVISVHYVTNIILLRNSNYIVDVVIRPKFGNCGISMTEVIIISILQGPNQTGLGLALGMALGGKGVKTKSHIMLIPTFVEVTGGETGKGWGVFLPSLRRVNTCL